MAEVDREMERIRYQNSQVKQKEKQEAKEKKEKLGIKWFIPSLLQLFQYEDSLLDIFSILPPPSLERAFSPLDYHRQYYHSIKSERKNNNWHNNQPKLHPYTVN